MSAYTKGMRSIRPTSVVVCITRSNTARFGCVSSRDARCLSLSVERWQNVELFELSALRLRAWRNLHATKRAVIHLGVKSRSFTDSTETSCQ